MTGRTHYLPQAVPLTQSIGKALGDSLQHFDKHIVIESAMKLWLFRYRATGAIIEDDSGGMPVHRGTVVNPMNVGIGNV